MSLKCLNLFANLYNLANYTFNTEYCVDNFNQMFNHRSNKLLGKGIYTELKKLSLVSYLKKLNDPEREKEVIFYLTEFNTKQESIRTGSSPPSEELSKMSFFSQQVKKKLFISILWFISCFVIVCVCVFSFWLIRDFLAQANLKSNWKF